MDFRMPQPEHVTTGCRTRLHGLQKVPQWESARKPCIALVAVKDGCGADGIR
jgi:hypothetical protein